MDHWEYQILVVDTHYMVGILVATPVISTMWELRGPDGLTDWDRLQKMGRDGWELVSSTPIATGYGVTMQVVFTFKRKAQAQTSVAAPQSVPPQP